MANKKGKTASSGRAKRFDAPLERMRSRLSWTIVRMPFDAAAVWGKRGQIRVKGEINGAPFRMTLFPDGRGGHYLLVNKTMQKKARCGPGSMAHFELERDTEKRSVRVPLELTRILAEDRAFRRWYDTMTHSARHWIARWVGEPKSAAVRTRRAEQMGERLFETMEAERELPPLLKIAFARNPLAAQGWETMSVAQCRAHLLGIFYYRTPEARAKRLEKVLADAAARAEKKR
jgi:uncharacterized protein YdeI (YjbR/CyaY-like superfamily)